MANLFYSNLTGEDLAKIFSEAPHRQILPAAGSKAWAAVAQNPVVRELAAPLRARAEQEINTPLPELTDALYRDFHATGNRLNFETVYFERRRRLARAAMCALLEPEEPAWMESLRQKTRELFDEFSWALPAHVNSISGKDSMQIDLFAAETANLMAELINVFGAALGDDLVAKIKSRLRSQFFENYVNRHEDLSWTLNSGNWNAVCHQGVIGAALSVEEDAGLLARMLMLTKKYLPVFLGGYGEDGACSEGPGYWQYGFGWYCVLNEQLEIRSNGHLSLMEGDTKIPHIARYGPRVSLPNFHFVNFADSSQSGSINPALLTYLADRLGDEYLRRHALHHYQYIKQHGLKLDSERCDFFYLVRLFLRAPSDLSPHVDLDYEDIFFKDLAVLVAHGRDARGNLWDFAAKGGTNNEHHNHNDCGSYIVNINGEPMIVEIGSPEYTRDFFRERRYEYLAARTLGHSLPIVNGCEQAAGPHYVAKVLNREMEPERVHFCVDITQCYPPAAGCSEVVRDFQWDKNRGLIQVKDYYELTKHESFESSVITSREVTLTEHEAVIQGEGVRLVIKPSDDTTFAGMEEHEYRDHSGIPRKVRRIIMKPQKIEDQRSINYEISIAE